MSDDTVRRLAEQLYRNGAGRSGCDLAILAGVRAGIRYAAEEGQKDIDEYMAAHLPCGELLSFIRRLRALAEEKGDGK